MVFQIKSTSAAAVILALVGQQAAMAAPQAALTAEWLTPACEFPAKFRVTVRNTGREAFAVPRAEDLGHGQPINFTATLAEGVFAYNDEQHFSSEYFVLPPQPPGASAALVDLQPGDSEAFELEFDGVFNAHGGPFPTYEGPWRGQFRFYYFLPSSSAVEHAPAILSSAAEASARSNILECA